MREPLQMELHIQHDIMRFLLSIIKKAIDKPCKLSKVLPLHLKILHNEAIDKQRKENIQLSLLLLFLSTFPPKKLRIFHATAQVLPANKRLGKRDAKRRERKRIHHVRFVC